MTKECPQCRSTARAEVGRCAACGYQFVEEKPKRRWEDLVVPYLAVAVLLAIILAVLLFFRR